MTVIAKTGLETRDSGVKYGDKKQKKPLPGF
jgi:hypothetical protein